MTGPQPDRVHAEQVRQRARVGLIGLAAVVLLVLTMAVAGILYKVRRAA